MIHEIRNVGHVLGHYLLLLHVAAYGRKEWIYYTIYITRKARRTMGTCGGIAAGGGILFMRDICSKYESIGDILEYGNITEKEAVILCNQIINESISENDNEILEAMYHAIFIGIVNRKISDKLDVNTIVKMLDKFNEEVSDYIVTILAYTGKKEYAETIKRIGQRFENIDIDDALIELNAVARQ